MAEPARDCESTTLAWPRAAKNETSVDLKTAYARIQSKTSPDSRRLNHRLFETYDRVARGWAGTSLGKVNVDLGGGDGGFSAACADRGIASEYFDLTTSSVRPFEFSPMAGWFLCAHQTG